MAVRAWTDAAHQIAASVGSSVQSLLPDELQVDGCAILLVRKAIPRDTAARFFTTGQASFQSLEGSAKMTMGATKYDTYQGLASDVCQC